MARGLAIRSIVTQPNDRFEVGYAGGSPVAQDGQSGSAVFSSQQHMIEEALAFEAGLTDYQLMLLHLAITYVKPDGSLGNPNQVLNKELRFDVTAANPVRIV